MRGASLGEGFLLGDDLIAQRDALGADRGVVRAFDQVPHLMLEPAAEHAPHATRLGGQPQASVLGQFERRSLNLMLAHVLGEASVKFSPARRGRDTLGSDMRLRH